MHMSYSSLKMCSFQEMAICLSGENQSCLSSECSNENIFSLTKNRNCIFVICFTLLKSVWLDLLLIPIKQIKWGWNFPSASHTRICCHLCFPMACWHWRLGNCSYILVMVISILEAVLHYMDFLKIWNIHKPLPCIHHVSWIFRDARL